MKIVLAIDPFDKNLGELKPRYETLGRWCDQVKTDVLPVYVTSSSRSVEAIVQASQIDKAIPGGLKSFAPMQVIMVEENSRKKEIEAVIKFAENQDADMIALVSQGKSSVEKKLMGSFAEALLLKSDRPVLFIGDKGDEELRENKVLFATDFSDASWRAFLLLLRQMKDKQPEILIFNAIPLPQFAGAGPIYAQALNLLPDEYWQEQESWARKEAQRFESLATMNGFKCRMIIANQVSSIERSIRQILAVENVKLIALASVSNSLQRFLVGSVSRSILRDRLIRPVWICGPQALVEEE